MNGSTHACVCSSFSSKVHLWNKNTMICQCLRAICTLHLHKGIHAWGIGYPTTLCICNVKSLIYTAVPKGLSVKNVHKVQYLFIAADVSILKECTVTGNYNFGRSPCSFPGNNWCWRASCSARESGILALNNSHRRWLLQYGSWNCRKTGPPLTYSCVR